MGDCINLCFVLPVYQCAVVPQFLNYRTNAGVVYHFRDVDASGRWSQQSKIVVVGSAAGDSCGSGVSLVDKFAVIGCPGTDTVNGIDAGGVLYCAVLCCEV